MSASFAFERARKRALLLDGNAPTWRDMFLKHDLAFAQYKITSEHEWKELLAVERAQVESMRTALCQVVDAKVAIVAERERFRSRCKQLEAEFEQFKKDAVKNCQGHTDFVAAQGLKLEKAEKEVARLKADLEHVEARTVLYLADMEELQKQNRFYRTTTSGRLEDELKNEKKLHTYFKKRALEAEDTICGIDKLINPEEWEEDDEDDDDD
jgi:hypothetical protein